MPNEVMINGMQEGLCLLYKNVKQATNLYSEDLRGEVSQGVKSTP